MLNEISILEKGLAAAGFAPSARHADVQSPGRTHAIRVRLGAAGNPVEVSPIDGKRLSALWTMRRGKHNSFPYMQIKEPLLSVPANHGWQAALTARWEGEKPVGRRACLRELASSYPVDPARWNGWPGKGLIDSLRARRAAIGDRDAGLAVVTASIDRFIAASGDPALFVASLVTCLLGELDTADTDFLELLRGALCGRISAKAVVGPSIYIDVARGEFPRDVADAAHIGPLSVALLGEGTAAPNADDLCALTGIPTALHSGPYPQPTLGPLGQIYLFSRNADTPAFGRYGRSGATTLPVGAELVRRLSGALTEITSEHRHGLTWRTIPSEKPKQRDLLIAFVDGMPDLAAADVVASSEDDWSDEDEGPDGRAVFTEQVRRVVEAVKGKAPVDFADTPVTVCILRKIDLGNGKAVLHHVLTVGQLQRAADEWTAAERNLPEWLTMPVLEKGKKLRWLGAPHIAPLQLPRLTQSVFIRDGAETAARSPAGVVAQDALTLFLDGAGVARVARATLDMVLARQQPLLAGAAQALRKGAGRQRDNLKEAMPFLRARPMRSVSLLGILLAKNGRIKGAYMKETAFKLGQLLAALDVVHVGYCMSVRDERVPPSLLGNSLLNTAQSDPVRALAVLARRWKPYGAWASNPHERAAAIRLTKSENDADKRRGWAIRSALSEAHKVGDVCRELHGKLPEPATDLFRAELLLGYVAGLPRGTRGDGENSNGGES